MKNEKFVLVVGDQMHYARPFHKYGRVDNDLDLLKSPENISLAIFTGGADVLPILYGEEPSKLTSTHPQRDAFEYSVFQKIKELNIPMFGICRGSQFLCVMAGGKLVQHVDNHDWHHDMQTYDGREFMVSSTHHQMMLPPSSASVLGWANPRLSKVYIGGANKRIEAPEKENEVVYFPNINAIGTQYHPEMMESNSEGYMFCEELVDEFLIKK